MFHCSENTENENIEKYIKDLKEKLVQFYKSKQNTVPLSSLFEEVKTCLAGFYVMPDMVLVKQKSLTSDQEERTPVRSQRDLFTTKKKGQQEIYASVDAGFAKTPLSKYLAITWAQACCPDDDRNKFEYNEINALGDFEFVFLLFLRDCNDVCYIDKMIEQQIIEKLPPSESQCPLQEILDKEKCLIVLDGIDEWTHPDNDCYEENKNIPHWNVRDKCVILTTTRPWKLEVSNLTTDDLRKKVELHPQSEGAMYQLEKNAVRKMIGVNDDEELKEKTQDLDEVINDHDLKHMQTIPLLLMYITCLLCNKIPIGNSKVEVYVNIVESLLSRTAQKHPEVKPSSEPSDCDIPEYFKIHKFCQKFYSVITKLTVVAHQTLCSEKRENTLVFDGSVADRYLAADDMKLCLLSGILKKSTTTTLSKVSFSHKTVQEFFAAMFISCYSDAKKTVLENCENVQSILDASMIYEFLSKMNSKMISEISAGFMSVINEDEKTRKYRTSTDDIYWEPLYNIQKLLLSCLKEMPKSENIKLCLQDFFINCVTIHDKNLQRLLKQNQTNIKSLYIKMLNTSSSLREVVESFSLADLNNLHKLYYRGSWQKADISVLLFPGLQNVTLSSATLINEGKLHEKFTALKNVKYLDIGGLKLSHETVEIIYNLISGKQTVEELTLSRLFCREHGEYCLTHLNLSECSHLKHLHLSRLSWLQLNLTSRSLVDVTLEKINLHKSSLLLYRDMLKIERVELSEIKMSAESFLEFIKVVEKLPQSVTVEMFMCAIEPKTEYQRVRHYVRSSQTFVVTSDDGQLEFVFQTNNRHTQECRPF